MVMVVTGERELGGSLWWSEGTGRHGYEFMLTTMINNKEKAKGRGIV